MNDETLGGHLSSLDLDKEIPLEPELISLADVNVVEEVLPLVPIRERRGIMRRIAQLRTLETIRGLWKKKSELPKR